MVRLVPVLLAVTLLLSAPGVAALAGAPGALAGPAQDAGSVAQSQPENTTSLLLLDDVQASNLTQPEPNLATTLSMQGSELDGEFEREVIERGLGNVSGEDRTEFVFVKSVHLRNEAESLLADEQQAREAYIAGELSAEEYLRTLAVLSARADAIQPSKEVLRREVSGEAERQLGFVRSDLPVLTGPILDSISGTVQGDGTPPTVRVEVSPTGLVLSRVDGETYVREAYRSDRVDKDGLELSLGDAESKLASWYPWAVGPNFGGAAIRFGPAAWQMEWTHEHATILTYFYGNTSGPYHEVQHKSLPDYPFESPEETFGSDMVLTVNRTYAGGPMEVRLTNETGTPLDGEVRIDGSAVGSTGDDGTLWVLQPEGSFTVMAVHEGERITLDLDRVSVDFVEEQ